MSTGVKKVIGIGRSVKGLRKDGTFFPLHLAVSEVIEGGLHLFTAIVRDLTEQVLMEEKLQAEEDRQKREMKLLMDNLAVARKKSENLLSQMLPENIADRIMGGEIVKPESYDSCTIFFSNIVGFSDIAASSQSIEIVNLLNDLYTYFDSIIDNHGINI